MKYSDPPGILLTHLTTMFPCQAVRRELTRVQLLCIISTGLHSVRYRPDLLTSAPVQGKVSLSLIKISQSLLLQEFWPPSYTSSPAAPWQCGAAWPPAVQHQHHQPGELPVQVLPPRLPGLVHHPSPGSENAGLNGGERSHQPGPPAAPGGSASP